MVLAASSMSSLICSFKSALKNSSLFSFTPVLRKGDNVNTGG
jgi:hypothetical protein